MRYFLAPGSAADDESMTIKTFMASDVPIAAASQYWLAAAVMKITP